MTFDPPEVLRVVVIMDHPEDHRFDEEETMRARVGDELTIDGHKVGGPKRVGQVVEVRGDDGGPPYRVRWDETGTTTLLYPGSDCHVRPVEAEEVER